MIIAATIFYLVGAVIVGAMFASSNHVAASWRGKPTAFPRLVVGIGTGIIWPFALLKLLFRPL